MIRILNKVESLISKIRNGFFINEQQFLNPGTLPLIINILRIPISFLAFALDIGNGSYVRPEADKYNLKSLIGDGFLFAVPKHRRSVERNLQRKFGSPDHVWKMLRTKSNLANCQKCGNYYEVGLLCRK